MTQPVEPQATVEYESTQPSALPAQPMVPTQAEPVLPQALSSNEVFTPIREAIRALKGTTLASFVWHSDQGKGGMEVKLGSFDDLNYADVPLDLSPLKPSDGKAVRAVVGMSPTLLKGRDWMILFKFPNLATAPTPARAPTLAPTLARVLALARAPCSSLRQVRALPDTPRWAGAEPR